MPESRNVVPIRLRAIEDPHEIGQLVAPLIWGEPAANDLERLTVEDKSGAGGGRVFYVRMENADPPVVVLKILGEQSASPIAFRRRNAAENVFRKTGLTADKLAEGEDWYIESFAGTSAAQDYFHFDPALAPASALARLLAKIHQVPADWYEPYREETIARDSVIGPVLASAPNDSHCWNPFGYGLENGMVFLGGGFPNPDTARDIMARQVRSGVFQMFLEAECFHPRSEAGRRVVTCHLDFKPDNILVNRAGLVPIDFEFTCAGPAVNDFGHMMMFWLGSQLQPYDYRHAFLAEYLHASRLPNDDGAVRALMLDAEINTLCTLTGLLSNIYDQQVPLLRGAPHPTAGAECTTADSPTGHEIIKLLAAAIDTVHESKELSDEVIRNGVVPTLYARKVGTEPLWKFIDEMKENNMLRLFGIYPTSEKDQQ